MDIKIKKEDLHEASHLRLQAHYGKVYIYKNKRVFRGINDSKVDEILTLMNSGLIQRLIKDKLFPNTNISNVILKEYKLVIEHEKIPLRNMYTKWSFDMLKESARTTLLVNSIANEFGYELRDAHFLNTMFYYGNSIFIDLDSFVPKKSDGWSAYKQFINSYMKLLQLLALQSNIEYQNSVKAMAYYIPNKFYERVLPKEEQYDLTEELSISSLLNNLDNLRLDNVPTMWSKYHDVFTYDLEKDIRLKEIVSQIKKLAPYDIVDLASNAGNFAKVILSEVKSVEHIICIDNDHESINKLFNNIEDYHITPLYNSIESDYYKVISDKPKADIALALALTHHLLLSAKYDIDFIFELISSYSKKYVLIEFMPLGLYSGETEKAPKLPSFYTQEWFENKFLTHYKILFKKEISLNRVLFVGEIR